MGQERRADERSCSTRRSTLAERLVEQTQARPRRPGRPRPAGAAPARGDRGPGERETALLTGRAGRPAAGRRLHRGRHDFERSPMTGRRPRTAARERPASARPGSRSTSRRSAARDELPAALDRPGGLADREPDHAVAIPFQVYQLTDSTLLVGLLAVAELVPLLTSPLVGGASRTPSTAAGSCSCPRSRSRSSRWRSPSNALARRSRASGRSSCSRRSPARRSSPRVAGAASLTPRLVPRTRSPPPSRSRASTSSLGAVAGPAVGGLLIAGRRPPGDLRDRPRDLRRVARRHLARCRDSARRARPSRRGCARSAEGLRYVCAEARDLGILLVDTNAMIFGMPTALFPAFATTGSARRGRPSASSTPRRTPVRSRRRSSRGWVGHVRRQGLAVAVVAAAWGVAIVLFGLARALWLALVVLALAGAADFVSAILRSTILLQATPDDARPRVRDRARPGRERAGARQRSRRASSRR